MDSVAGASPRQLARVAGALYLINIVGGAFAISIVPAAIEDGPGVFLQVHRGLTR